MIARIDVETLRAWLDEKRPVTVLDIRPADDRRQWSIPGSIHVDAYGSLRAGDPGPLANVLLPSGQPVVTVCGAGRMSETAAELLAARGVDARSLVGGMKAWSLAWNTADVPLRDASVRVIQVRRTGKGCLSYIVGSRGEAAVIDPSVDLEVYVTLAIRFGWRIRSVVETHVHADHLSRARALASRVDAALRLPDQQRVRFAFDAACEGSTIRVGAATLTALHTPGHTAESTSYVLNDLVVFTGDTLFVDGVGRPDLRADLAGARRRARTLFQSLARLRTLGPALLVLPGHTSDPVPFDGQVVGASLEAIDHWLPGWLASEEGFVERIVSRLPPTPPNFERIVAANEAGESPEGDPADLEAGANRCAVS